MDSNAEVAIQSNKETLIQIVKDWVITDNQIKALNKKLRELRQAKKEQNTQMIEVMKAHEIDNFDIKDGQIYYKKEVKREPLSQKTLLNILSKHPQLDDIQANNLNQFIYDSRKITEKDVIVRKMDNKPS
jgi:hypothetical protein